jgi:hypothetical protein
MHQQMNGTPTIIDKIELIERELIWHKQEKKRGRKFGAKRKRRMALLRAIAKDLRAMEAK